MEKSNTNLIEPTDEEKRNGWTAETLTDYIYNRKMEQAETNSSIGGAHFPHLDRDPDKPFLTHCDNDYNPQKW